MLASAEQKPPAVEAPRRAEIVVAVDGATAPEPAEVLRAGHRIGHQLGAAYPDRSAVVLLLSAAAENAPAVPTDPRAPQLGVPLLPWSHVGQGALEATLRAGEAFEAAACALVAADGDDGRDDVVRRLVAPVLEDGCDLCLPLYATHRYEGVITTGIVYPFTRALYGKRLRQPLAPELAVSRRAVSHLLGEAWLADAAHAGERLWLLSALLAGGFEACQAALGGRPRRVAEAGGADLAVSLAQVVGLVFHEARLHAPAWQRVKGSRAVRLAGDLAPAPGEAGQPAVGPMISAFQLGYQELQRLWSAVLPPQTLLALKRLAACPEERFAVEDALWARLVYDFAVAYHLGAMDRALLLRSMTPLYLAWVASFVREVRELAPALVDERVERLARGFEAAKPYLISRWRWPDRFNP